MEQTFLLIYYGAMNLYDIRRLTNEERAWYIKRIDKEMQTKNEAHRKAMKGPMA